MVLWSGDRVKDVMFCTLTKLKGILAAVHDKVASLRRDSTKLSPATIVVSSIPYWQ